MSGKTGNFEATKPPACLLWPASRDGWNHRASLSGALTSVAYLQRYSRCLFNISPIRTLLDFTIGHSAELWAIGRLCRWYIARYSVYFHPCVHHIFGCYKIPRLTFIAVLSMFFVGMSVVQILMLASYGILPPSCQLRCCWHRLDLFGHALWPVVDVKTPRAAV